ncbi:HD-GYP domain-containing protein [Celerinatantimonas diazotrophica]|uniref:Uncharacterized protein DUF3391 n=1 Tax=Celerinatantimonas diazotrophica TaxID=412034 RepID=A0A4R1JLK8_9GAMM|nr:HD-GYP domain-containing protein [Celerinatantimonas diazotrophica]TCK51820.1 uncharacterized protein DUF3391 [Celerinatantimonas diazotrophica]CAG9296488.1 Cyclic di-GMP phosphodiesterase [Celerinatantimonas diazotrophica]
MSVSKLPLNKLEIGHYVCLPIGWTNHPFLFNNFKIRTEEELIVLQNLPFTEIEVNFAKSDVRESLPQSPMTYEPIADNQSQLSEGEQFSHQEKKRHRQTTRWYVDQVGVLQNAIAHFASQPILSYTELLHCVEKLCAPIFESQRKPNVYLIFNTKQSDNLFNHSINICVLAILISRTLGFSLKATQDVALAALIQDIGMLRVPFQIRNKKDALNTAEKNYYHAHINYSLELLKRNQNFPPQIIELVAMHHERLDGSGYPKGLLASQLSEHAQILQVVDSYETFINPNPWQKPIPPQLAIALLLKHSDKLFNKTIVEALANALGIYPPGTIVQLENGKLALVSVSNHDDKLNPFIRQLSSPLTQEIEDLPIENLTLISSGIVKTVQEAAIPTDIAQKWAHFQIGYLYGWPS